MPGLKLYITSSVRRFLSSRSHPNALQRLQNPTATSSSVTVQFQPLLGRRFHYAGYHQRSHKSRLVRSVVWMSLFGVAGVGAGIYYKSWFYQKLGSLKPGTEIDLKMTADVHAGLERNPTTLALTADPSFVEVWPMIRKDLDGNGSLMTAIRDSEIDFNHLFVGSLQGRRGLFPRAFYNGSNGVLCFVVSFGPGMVGYDRENTSAGALAIVLEEAMCISSQPWFQAANAPQLEKIEFNFDAYDAPVPFDSMASVLVYPALTVGDLDSTKVDPEQFGTWPDWLYTQDREERGRTFIAYVVSAMGSPCDPAVPKMRHATAVGVFRRQEKSTAVPQMEKVQTDSQDSAITHEDR